MTDLKRVLITSISSELGGVLASELANDSSVKIIGTMRRKRSKTDRFPQNVRLLDGCDLTKPDDCSRVAEAAGDGFDGPFAFIHSVGDFWEHVPFLDFESKQAARMFDSHINTLYNSLQALIPVMLLKGAGASVAFSCNSVRYNYPWMASFTASKSAVDSLVRSLAYEFAGNNLRFNSLVLASVQTEKVRTSKPHGDFSHYIPPADIVPIIRFLLSSDAYLVNGNAISLFRHSEQFYGMGYFQRIAK